MRPINSIKHIVDNQGGTVGGTPTFVNLVAASDVMDNTIANRVETGCRVSSLFLNIQVLNQDDTALPNMYFIIYKNPGSNIGGGDIPNANATGTSDFRKQIFHTEMAMMSDTGDSIPITLFKGVLKVPQRFQRMGINDIIAIQLFSPGTNTEFCVECIYKEYR